MSAPGIIIAAPASGSGKTTVTLALLRALAARGPRGRRVQGRPRLHRPDASMPARPAGRRSISTAGRCASRPSPASATGSRTAVELVLGEGVMGLFDGAGDGQGSTADLASLFDLPVILVVDARGMARLGGGAGRGLHPPSRRRRDRRHRCFNRVASAEHAALLRRACDDRFAQPVLACLPSDPRLELPARHLGLVQAAEVPELEPWLDARGRDRRRATPISTG